MTPQQEINNYRNNYPNQKKGWRFKWSDLRDIKNQNPDIDGIGFDLGLDENGNFTLYAYGMIGKNPYVAPPDSVATIKIKSGYPCPDWCN